MRNRRPNVLLPVLLAVLMAICVGPLPIAAALSADEYPVGSWPLSPRPAVVNGFDPPTERWLPGHRGVDLAGTIGQPVMSALPGTVRWAGRLAGRGIVVVGHGDTRTTYQPVTPSLAVGAPVDAGDVIGNLERIGSHCLPSACLHWGWLRGDTYLNPLLLVGGLLPVRLLPLEAQAGISEPAPSRPVRQPMLRWAPTVRGLLAMLPGTTLSLADYRTWSRQDPGVSGARVGLAIRRAEPVGAHVGVELSGGQ